MHKKFAILVGANEYQDPINNLRFCVDDAKELRRILVDKKRGGYGENTAILLTDENQQETRPTRSNIMFQVSRISKTAGPEDTILFAFSGHGMEEHESSYLLPADARNGVLADTAIEVKWIMSTLDKSPAREKIMILDACHAGAMKGKAESGQMTEAFHKETRNPPKGFAVLSSCTLHEYSYEWEEKKHGVFSYYLCQGLNGDADTDGDGRIAVSDANKYVAEQVKDWAFTRGFQQNPHLDYNVSGDIILTYVPGSFKPSPNARITDECVISIALLHIDNFRVSAEYYEYRDNPEWDDKEQKAHSAAAEMAPGLCAKLLNFYNADQIRAEGDNYEFPDGSISISTSSYHDDHKIESQFEVTIKYNPVRRDLINDIITMVFSYYDWYSIKYRCNRKFDVNRLVDLLKKSGLTIESYDPTGNSPICAHADDLGTTGHPSMIYFEDLGDGSAISILPEYIEDDFYDKLNPKTIVDLFRPAFV